MLNRGDLGFDVIEWQAFLRAKAYRGRAGAEIAVNGEFDEETEHATMCFQRDHGLDPTGIFCPRTEAVARKLGWRAG